MTQDHDLALDEPRGIGEIISDSVQTMRRHLKTTLVFMLPFCALELIAREAGSTLGATMRKNAEVLQAGAELDWGVVRELAVTFAGSIGMLFVSLLIVVVIVAAATVHAREVMNGRTLAPGEVVKRGLRIAPRVVLAEVLFDLTLLALTVTPWTVAIVGIFLVDDTLAQIGIIVVTAVVWLALVLTVYLRWVLFPQIIVLENKGPIAALIRSTELMGPAGVRLLKGPKLRLSLVLFIYWCVASVVQSTFILPLGIVGFLEGIPLEEMPPPLAYVPLWVAIPVAVVQVLANSVLYPLKAYLPTLFYYDLLVRYGEDNEGDVREPSA